MRTLLTIAFLATASAGAIALPAAPVLAQTQDRVIDVYGDDPCPSSQGQGIVVCRRLPKREQYRIPKDLREEEPSAQALGGQAVAAVNSTGGTGVQINSCNAIGAGVNAGCLKNEADAWAAQKKAEKKAEAGIP